MTGRERVLAAMNLEQPDRVPVMCQLSMGHYLVNLDMSPAEYWIDSELMAGAFIKLAERYDFDGILINPATHRPHRADRRRRDDPLRKRRALRVPL